MLHELAEIGGVARALRIVEHGEEAPPDVEKAAEEVLAALSDLNADHEREFDKAAVALLVQDWFAGLEEVRRFIMGEGATLEVPEEARRFVEPILGYVMRRASSSKDRS